MNVLDNYCYTPKTLSVSDMLDIYYKRVRSPEYVIIQELVQIVGKLIDLSHCSDKEKLKIAGIAGMFGALDE